MHDEIERFALQMLAESRKANATATVLVIMHRDSLQFAKDLASEEGPKINLAFGGPEPMEKVATMVPAVLLHAFIFNADGREDMTVPLQVARDWCLAVQASLRGKLG